MLENKNIKEEKNNLKILKLICERYELTLNDIEKEMLYMKDKFELENKKKCR